MQVVKKMPETEETVAGIRRIDRIEIARVEGQLNYNKFSRYLQEIPGYSVSAGEAEKIRKKKYVFDDWLRVAVAAKLVSKLERRVLEFIGERTLRYGKSAEIVTRMQFLNGFVNNGVLEVAAAVSNARQWYQATASLSGKGFIWITKITSGRQHYHTVYGLNLDEMLNLKGVIKMKDAAPRNYRNTIVQNDTTPPGTPQCHFALLNTIRKKEITEVTTARTRTRTRRVTGVVGKGEVALECKNNVLSVLEKVAERTHQKRTAKAQKTLDNPKQITMSSINALWQKIVVEQHGPAVNAIGLTTAEFGIFKAAIRNHHFTFRWDDFFRWVVQSWRFIVTDHKRRVDYARKMEGHSGEYQPQLPQAPSLSTVARRFAMFAKRYTDSMYVPDPNTEAIDELARARKRAEEMERRASAAERKLSAAESTITKLAQIKSSSTPRMALSATVAPDRDDGLSDWPMEG